MTSAAGIWTSEAVLFLLYGIGLLTLPLQVGLFVRLLNRSFVRSFIHSFIHSLPLQV